MSGPAGKLSESPVFIYGEDPRPHLRALVDSGRLGPDVRNLSQAARRILVRTLDLMEAHLHVGEHPFPPDGVKNGHRWSLRIDKPTRERVEQAWRDHPLRFGSRTLTAFAADVLGRGIGMEEALLAAGQVSPPAVSESNIPPAPEPPAPVEPEVFSTLPPLVFQPCPVPPTAAVKATGSHDALVQRMQAEILANEAQRAREGMATKPAPITQPVHGLTPEEVLVQATLAQLEILAAGVGEPAPVVGIELVEPFKTLVDASKAAMDLAAPLPPKSPPKRRR